MAKQKKKRNKRYQGSDAKAATPTIVRVSAEERSRFKEWWLTYRQLVKIGGAVVGILIVLALVIIGLIGMFVR